MNGRHYNVTVTGDVQDIGFRSFIENTANSYVWGYVFNDLDGSVKMLCSGSAESLISFSMRYRRVYHLVSASNSL